MAKRADDAGQLGTGAGGFGNGRARTAAADRETLKKAGCQIGGAKPHHLLVGIDMGAQSSGIGTRKHAGVRKRNQRNSAAADQYRDDIAVGDPGDGETRQALRKRTEDRHAVAGPKTKHADEGGRRNYRNQNAWQPLVVLEQQDDRQRAEPNPECDPVCLSFKDCIDDRP